MGEGAGKRGDAAYRDAAGGATGQVCGRQSPTVGRLGVHSYCTRKRGHDGEHVACTSDGDEVARWSFVETDPESPICRAESPPDADGNRWICTLPKGHAGPHVARGVDEKVAARWPAESDSAAMRAASLAEHTKAFRASNDAKEDDHARRTRERLALLNGARAHLDHAAHNAEKVHYSESNTVRETLNGVLAAARIFLDDLKENGHVPVAGFVPVVSDRHPSLDELTRIEGLKIAARSLASARDAWAERAGGAHAFEEAKAEMLEAAYAFDAAERRGR